MRFPVKVRYRGVVVKIYSKTSAYSFYRVAGRVAGRRKVVSFKTYAEARQYAEKLAKQIYEGKQSALLSEHEVSEVLAAKAALQRLAVRTGREIGFSSAITQFCDAVELLPPGVSLCDAVSRYVQTLSRVREVTISKAVDEYVSERQAMTVSRNGGRPQLSPKVAYNESVQLSRLAGCIPNTVLANLSADHLRAFFSTLAGMTPKTRNHYRNSISAFLNWAKRREYIADTGKLLECDVMQRERDDVRDIEFYTPTEFAALLNASDGIVQVMIAIAGLAGLRIAELLRLTWEDVWRVPGHIEVGRLKSKTRQRRLVPICPALAAWLEPWRERKNGLLWQQREITFQRHLLRIHEAAGVKRKPNGLRHSFCTFAYALHGETNTAQWAGHSPSQLFQHYRGLATKHEAEAWFGVLPAMPTNVIGLASGQNK